MSRCGPAVAALIVLICSRALDLPDARAQGDASRPTRGAGFAIQLRPGTLGDQIDSLAGHPVRLLYARVVGVFDPRAFLIETQAPMSPLLGHRSRVVVLIETGELRVDPASLVASTVTVSGIARTLLGIQVTREAPWPSVLTRNMVERLEIRAAVLAQSVTTAEGDDLLVRSSGLP